jgi:predicted nuclease of predicted toxin-antitoxin system
VEHNALSFSDEGSANLQDSLYLAAARRLDASVITADKKFSDRAAAHDKRVSLLAGCEGTLKQACFSLDREKAASKLW